VSDDKQLMGSIVNDFRADTSREIFFCVFKSGRIRWMGCVTCMGEKFEGKRPLIRRRHI
jgi:hypothetical protein